MLQRLKATFYPIERQDLAKALPLWGSLFLLTFCYIGTKCVKYAVFLDQASGGPGAAYVPHAKLLTMLLAFLSVAIYGKLCNHFLRERLAFVLLVSFSVMLLGYDLLRPSFPLATAWFMYSLSELYSSVLQITMFWSLVNNLCTVQEGKRIYPFIFLGSQIGGMVSGKLANAIIGSYGIQPMIYLVAFLTLCNAFLLLWYGRWLEAHPELLPPVEKVELRSRTSALEGLRLLLRKRYLLLIFVIMVCYNVCIIMVDFQYKVRMEGHITGQENIGALFGDFYFYVNLASLLFLLFITKNIIRYVGLTVCLILLPLTMGLPAIISFMTAGWLMGLVASGIGQAGKYAFFDPSKELLYVPCTVDEKYKAKGAIDLIGHRGGKGLASVINIIIHGYMVLWESLVYSLVFSGLLLLWIGAAVKVGKRFKEHLGGKAVNRE